MTNRLVPFVIGGLAIEVIGLPTATATPMLRPAIAEDSGGFVLYRNASDRDDKPSCDGREDRGSDDEAMAMPGAIGVRGGDVRVLSAGTATHRRGGSDQQHTGHPGRRPR